MIIQKGNQLSKKVHPQNKIQHNFKKSDAIEYFIKLSV